MIKNIQTTMNVDSDRWDSIFHNWEDPFNCSQHKKATGCSICDKLFSGQSVTKDSIVYRVIDNALVKNIVSTEFHD